MEDSRVGTEGQRLEWTETLPLCLLVVGYSHVIRQLGRLGERIQIRLGLTLSKESHERRALGRRVVGGKSVGTECLHILQTRPRSILRLPRQNQLVHIQVLVAASDDLLHLLDCRRWFAVEEEVLVVPSHLEVHFVRHL
ncbi:hypothetical protein PENTCL1PPCAC_10769, partial [Pristionchus entomophagus]